MRSGLENRLSAFHYTSLSAFPSDSNPISSKRRLFAFKFTTLVVALATTKNSIVG
jgi:hypothetical protein